MIVKDIKFTLKDGREALLRCPKEEDIAGTLEYLRVTAEETDYLLRTPEECDKYTYEAEKEFFERNNADPNRCMLVCVVDGKVAGNCEISRYPNLKIRHRADIGIALISEFWGQGIGTQMFREMIRIAEEEWEGVTQIELGFVEGNSRARALYEKMGFRITGMRTNAYKLKDGTLHHEYRMVREMK